jgi:hypothetical protein
MLATTVGFAGYTQRDCCQSRPFWVIGWHCDRDPDFAGCVYSVRGAI